MLCHFFFGLFCPNKGGPALQSILASGQMSKGKAKPRTVFLVQTLDEVLDLGEKWQETLGVFETVSHQPSARHGKR